MARVHSTNNIPPFIDQASLPTLFADCAHQYPSNIALKFDDLTHTYQTINNNTNRFAAFLLSNNIGLEDRVAVALDRSPQMLVALLAILKSGAAYIPLDPEYPNDRIEYMLDDSSAKILITSKKYSARFKTTTRQLFIEDIWPHLNDFQTDEPEVNIAGNSLAYILYTSGSTGKPKGVPVEHHSLTNLLLSIQKTPGITEKDILLSVTTISFDIAAVELFLPLITGATIVLVTAETARDSRILLKVAREQNISIMQATPTTWRMMLEAGWDEPLPIKIFCGGEALTKDLAHKLIPKCRELWNMYGPTETTIYSIIKRVSISDEIITIGAPIHNTSIYLLDEHGQQVIAGEAGEICIGGDGVARGYLNKEALTHDKFITYPVSSSKSIRLYRTGDLGKILPNGDIQCLGRIDHQVKIRGFRIELGEIENVIQSTGLVSETVVVAKDDEDGNKNLIGYTIPNHDNLRSKERELYQEQVKSWEKVYEAEYEQPEHSIDQETNTPFNANIWKDSFTAKIIPADQMQEWLADIAKVILAGKPENVLEIGCGTGLIYNQIAPYIKKYIGTDFFKSGY